MLRAKWEVRFGQAPDFRRGDLQAVPGRVPEVNGVPSPRPVDLPLDRDAAQVKLLGPLAKLLRRRGEGNVPSTARAMRRYVTIVARALLRIEHQQHLLTAAKENMPLGLTADKHQPQNLLVELLSRVEVIRIEACFQERLQLHKYRTVGRAQGLQICRSLLRTGGS